MPTHTLTQRFKTRNPAQSYITPQKRFDEWDAKFHFTVDVAADASNAKCIKYYTIHDDGLAQDWSKEVVWCNPPWNGLRPWVMKAYEESQKGATVVMLIPVRSETGYWHDYILPHAEICHLKNITFEGFTHCVNFPCAIVIFRKTKFGIFQAYGSKGGKIAASRMSAEARRLRAQKAIQTRWMKAKKP